MSCAKQEEQKICNIPDYRLSFEDVGRFNLATATRDTFNLVAGNNEPWNAKNKAQLSGYSGIMNESEWIDPSSGIPLE